MMALSLPAGFGFMIIVMVVAEIVRHGYRTIPAYNSLPMVILLLFGAAIPPALLTFIFRERILRYKMETQKLLAALSCLFFIIIYGNFIYFQKY